jgi:hypothetical protein
LVGICKSVADSYDPFHLAPLVSYDLLGLRSLSAEITMDVRGHLALRENKLETTSRVAAPPNEVLAAKPEVVRTGTVAHGADLSRDFLA